MPHYDTPLRPYSYAMHGSEEADDHRDRMIEDAVSYGTDDPLDDDNDHYHDIEPDIRDDGDSDDDDH